MSMSMSALRTAFHSQGYVLVSSLITPTQLASLRLASARVVAKSRSGEWMHRRTVGKQFPPFDNHQKEVDVWGVQHVMHPELGEEAFAEWYAGDRVTGVVRDLLGCGEDELQMELFNLLINPSSHSFALRWHRDDIREEASEAEEKEALGKWHYGVQWNTALYNDACLWVVPKSHLEPRTQEQRAQSTTREAPKNPLDMPGAKCVLVKAGESVFYNSNILHTAFYDPSPTLTRATLHATMGSTQGGSSRARNILQHGLSWMREKRFRETLPEGRAKRMLDKLLDMEKDAGDFGYSLAG